MMRNCTISLVFLLLAACSTTASKISKVQLGMTRAEVEATLGRPVSTSAQGDRVYLNYKLLEAGDDKLFGNLTPYFVRLVGGKVESFGRAGDFDSTKVPTVRQQVEQVGSGSTDIYTELLRLKELKDKGLLTDAEFESRRQAVLNRK